MNVVGSRVCRSKGPAKFADNSAQVGEKIVVQRRGDERLTALGAENNVGKEVCVGVGHVLSPLRGLVGILLDYLTHRLRSGLRSFARFAGCHVEPVTTKGSGIGVWGWGFASATPAPSFPPATYDLPPTGWDTGRQIAD